jgi:hypothetical protein
MEYYIARSKSMTGLVSKVNELIALGWTPTGGLSISGGYAHAHFHQALTKAVVK